MDLASNECPDYFIASNGTERRVENVTIPIDSNGTFAIVNVWDVRSRFYSTLHDKTYYFHEELVTQNVTTTSDGLSEVRSEEVHLCEDCYKSNDKPELSIANGIDFGNYERIPHLQKLNLHERAILALVRRYNQVVKIRRNNGVHTDYTQSRLQAHVVMFEHDAVFVAANEILKIENMVQLLAIHFVGPHEERWIRWRKILGEPLCYSHDHWCYISGFSFFKRQLSGMRKLSFPNTMNWQGASQLLIAIL